MRTRFLVAVVGGVGPYPVERRLFLEKLEEVLSREGVKIPYRDAAGELKAAPVVAGSLQISGPAGQDWLTGEAEVDQGGAAPTHDHPDVGSRLP